MRILIIILIPIFLSSSVSYAAQAYNRISIWDLIKAVNELDRKINEVATSESKTDMEELNQLKSIVQSAVHDGKRLKRYPVEFKNLSPIDTDDKHLGGILTQIELVEKNNYYKNKLDRSIKDQFDENFLKFKKSAVDLEPAAVTAPEDANKAKIEEASKKVYRVPRSGGGESYGAVIGMEEGGYLVRFVDEKKGWQLKPITVENAQARVVRPNSKTNALLDFLQGKSGKSLEEGKKILQEFGIEDRKAQNGKLRAAPTQPQIDLKQQSVSQRRPTVSGGRKVIPIKGSHKPDLKKMKIHLMMAQFSFQLKEDFDEMRKLPKEVEKDPAYAQIMQHESTDPLPTTFEAALNRYTSLLDLADKIKNHHGQVYMRAYYRRMIEHLKLLKLENTPCGGGSVVTGQSSEIFEGAKKDLDPILKSAEETKVPEGAPPSNSSAAH